MAQIIPRNYSERLTVGLGLLALACFLVNSDWVWRADNLVYDALLKISGRPAPDDIVIVGIDNNSLSELGRWPWDRKVHSELIDRLTKSGAKAVLFDILLTESNSETAAGDNLLAQSVNENGRTVLPVAVEQLRGGGQLIESLPYPGLAETAAALGHAHVELDEDGIARSVYLEEGLGSPHWPHITVAVLRLNSPNNWVDLPGDRGETSRGYSINRVKRDHRILIPYAGAPGHFSNLSYLNVLKGRVNGDLLKDKIVLVGMTATGLGDALPTPLSGYGQPMPGVEVNANILDALRQRIVIVPLATKWRLLISGFLVLLPPILFPFLTPRAVLLTTGLLIVGTFILSGGFLQFLHWWFPPVAAIICLSLSYPFWSWRRLETAVRYLDKELANLHAERKSVLVPAIPSDTNSRLRFLQRVVPFNGWRVTDSKGAIIAQGGENVRHSAGQVYSEKWQKDGDHLRGRAVKANPVPLNVGIHWLEDREPTAEEVELLNDCIGLPQGKPQSSPDGSAELVEARIGQVHEVTEQLRTMRQFIGDTLRQMDNGVVVADLSSKVVFANKLAVEYLADNPQADLIGSELGELFDKLTLAAEKSWDDVYREVLLNHQFVCLDAKHSNGRCFLVQMAPMSAGHSFTSGMIVNFSDITELKQSEQKRTEALSFLSHDIRAPIVSLLSLVQLYRMRHDTSDSEEFLTKVEQFAGKTLQLCEDFLDLSKAEVSEPEEFEAINLVTVVYSALDDVYAIARRKDITVSSRVELDEALVLGDPKALERVITNLLNNAVQYSPKGATAELSLQGEHSQVICCVEDRGYGIPTEDLPKVFDRYYSSSHGERPVKRNIGLGLAYANVVIKKHGGMICVDSVVGQGSKFTFKLPRYDPVS